jgi:hypothetical protein
MLNKLRHLFLPHESNNHKAKSLQLPALFFLLLLIAGFQGGLTLLMRIKPGVLGFAANISPDRIIQLTNQRRAEQGLGFLQPNGLLSEAARQKAATMLTFGCWSHDCNGRTPWSFISGVGYSYTYAGENLAKDFNDSDAVVSAWMASPTHRDNILNGRYKEIGIAVVDGLLNGQETTLVVQMFGTPTISASTPVVPQQAVVEPEVMAETVPKTQEMAQALEAEEEPVVKEEVVEDENINEAVEVVDESELSLSQAGEDLVSQRPLISSFELTKTFYLIVLSIMVVLMLVDSILIYKNKVVRISGKTFVHASFFIIILLSILLSNSGVVI